MKKVYRKESNSQYWDRRWEEAGEDQSKFTNTNIYPIKYAEMIMTEKTQKTLEIGCGAGRVLKHYFYNGFNIEGMERSQVAVENAKKTDSNLPIQSGDAIKLNHPDSTYDNVLAFGVYHNIENLSEIKTALSECSRILKQHGQFCISIRPDNWEMNLNEWYWNNIRNKNNNSISSKKEFHRMLFTSKEFEELLKDHQLVTKHTHKAKNVSILYRFRFFSLYNSSEATNRSEGYKLNVIGKFFDKILTTLFPGQFCNVLVYIGTKEA